MSKKIIYLVLVVALLFPLGLSVATAAPLGQETIYTVVLGDNLWNLSEKYLGSGAAYRAIALATNAEHEEDPTFAKIESVSLIYPGWKFLIPSAEDAEALLAQVIKVGQVTDVGGIDDRSFNATAWKGVQDAIERLAVQGRYLESQAMTDYEPFIGEFLREDYDLIITVGWMLGDATGAAAEANPDTKFAIVDYAYDPVYDNVLGLVYATDEAAFLAGYVAAAATQTGKVGTFGGIPLPTVTIFMAGFQSGVEYYNAQHGTSVQVLGWSNETGEGSFTGNFESTDDGRRYTESLMAEGADIVLPVAGPVGLGTAAVCKETGRCLMVGVDTDFYVSAPEFKEIYLTSVLKNMDVSVFEAIKAVAEGTFEGGTFVGTLTNNGVGLAPFHEQEDRVPAEVVAELEEIKQGIMDGTIDTGWPLE